MRTFEEYESLWQTSTECLEAASNAESDRGFVLVVVAVLENDLQRLLEQAFVRQDAGLFQGGSALATFSSKIRIAVAFGLISERIGRQLDLTRRIRNDFAHTDQVVSFSDREVIQRLREFESVPVQRNPGDEDCTWWRAAFRVWVIAMHKYLLDVAEFVKPVHPPEPGFSGEVAMLTVAECNERIMNRIHFRRHPEEAPRRWVQSAR